MQVAERQAGKLGIPIFKSLTVIARNFDWEEPKMEKFYDVILMTFFIDDVFRK